MQGDCGDSASELSYLSHADISSCSVVAGLRPPARPWLTAGGVALDPRRRRVQTRFLFCRCNGGGGGGGSGGLINDVPGLTRCAAAQWS